MIDHITALQEKLVMAIRDYTDGLIDANVLAARITQLNFDSHFKPELRTTAPFMYHIIEDLAPDLELHAEIDEDALATILTFSSSTTSNQGER